jgi:RNA polymerase sigma factor (sigma-70 family)
MLDVVPTTSHPMDAKAEDPPPSPASPPGALAADELARRLEAARPRILIAIQHRLAERLRNVVDVEDVWQETAMAAMAQAERFVWKGELPFLRWLMTLAQRRLSDLYRHHLGRAGERPAPIPLEDLAHVLAGGSAGPATRAERQDEAERVRNAIARLPAVQREILALDVIQLMTPEEMAQHLGKSKETVQRAYLRALQSLRAELWP